ncbi:camk protein kinase [Colletotrichum incanum]|uniref:Camk protein kinase n=1 Tax=Colletotrichum incanum TaxID=1573173 RepID=A0A166LM86_COLIC|nr:camk protein kinase [Colletotrichum incanum]
MEYTDIVANIYPSSDPKGWVASAIKASSLYEPPQLEQQVRYRRGERASTEPPEDHGASALDYLPRLRITFDDVPRTNRGLTFGSNSNCDVVLDYRGISNCHFSLTFDDNNRLIVRDSGSLVGTQVTYDGEGEGWRRHFQWIVGGDHIPQRKESIIITLVNTISFQIVVPYHDINSPTYVGMANRFKHGTAAAESLLDDLGLTNPETRLTTGAHTPNAGEIFLRKKLGEGSFGTVTHLWNVSTGTERVVKEPTRKAVQGTQGGYSAWHREARIMGQISHPHIVTLFESSFTPHPRLYLEYVPCGSLADQDDISYDETLMIVRQCLSALAYLHGMEIPIAHRDIKPGNILVQYRSKSDICVKLGDFGLSRDSPELMTICGTRKYLAPEICSELLRYIDHKERLIYTTAVDIWSLGVVACELLCGLPQYHDRYRNNGVDWCRSIVTWLQIDSQKSRSDLGQFLLHTMVVISPNSRLPASGCYDLATKLPSAKDRYSNTSTPASSLHDDKATIRCFAEDYGADNLATIVFQPSSYMGAVCFGRSGAPPPASQNDQHNDEVDRFLRELSADPCNPIYVGSSLALDLGGGMSESWADKSSQDSVHQDRAQAEGAPTDSDPKLTEPSESWSNNREWHCDIGNSVAERGNLVDYEYEELTQAARLLHALGHQRPQGAVTTSAKSD